MTHPNVVVPFRRRHPDVTKDRAQARAAMRTVCATRAHQRIATRMAWQLAWLHGIRPYEATLVPWLTEQPCVNNGDALAQWVLRELRANDLLPTLPGPALLEALSEHLRRRLADVEDARS